MSDAVPYLIAAATIAIAVFVGPWAAAAFSLAAGSAYGDYQKRKAQQEAKRAYNDSLKDRTTTVRSATGPRKLALGRVRMGGVLLYADTVGTNQTQFDSVLAVCDGPIRRVRGLYVGDTYYSADQFSGTGQISTGQYSGQRRIDRYEEYRSASVQFVTITLSLDPVLSVDGVDLPFTVAAQNQGRDANKSWFTLPHTISGRVVSVVVNHPNLTPTTTGVRLRVSYSAGSGDSVLSAQWTTGDQTASTTWPGVNTPNWPATAVCYGVAIVRTLMTWDETAYQAGAPEINALIDGVCDVYDPRKNKVFNPDFLGASAGSPGALPTGAYTVEWAGLTRTLSVDTDSIGRTYLEIRWQGTPGATGSVGFYFQHPTYAAPVSPGSKLAFRVGFKLVSQAQQHSAMLLNLLSYDATNATITQAQTLINQTITDDEFNFIDCKTSSIAGAGSVKAGASINLLVTAGVTYDTTIRLVLPQLWLGDVGDDVKDPTGYSSNPALLVAWLHTRARNRMGCGTPWNMIDWISVAAAANVCDEQITVKKLDGTGYEQMNRYSCNTVISAENSPADNIAVILSSMAGDCVFTAGMYRVYPGAFRAPTRTLTDDDVLSGHGLTIYPNITGLDPIPNGMTATFADAALDYVETSAPAVTNENYVMSDGAAEDGDISLPATTDARQANYLMGVALEQARPAFGAELTVGSSAADIALLDTLSLDLAGYEAFADVVWEVRRRVNHFNGSYTLVLRQTKPNIYALNPDNFNVTTVPPKLDNSFLWTVHPVSNLAVTLSSVQFGANNTASVMLAVGWSQHSQPYVRNTGRIELRWRDYGSSQWSTVANFSGAQTAASLRVDTFADVRLELQARAVNGTGAASAWVSADFDVPVSA